MVFTLLFYPFSVLIVFHVTGQVNLDQDYENNTLKTTLLIHLFHRDVTDKFAHGIVKARESLNISPKRIIYRPR